jgi:hypothetical protein
LMDEVNQELRSLYPKRSVELRGIVKLFE